jgi:hypothetical protein
MYMTGAIGGYRFSLFLPIILKNSLQFSDEPSFILAAPPIIFAVIIGCTFAWLADKLTFEDHMSSSKVSSVLLDFA